ncbi:MAG: transcriptional repressor [Muribaculaceae bacterium]|nr:transcriptional repressor [Muribaculaceae bacterium]
MKNKVAPTPRPSAREIFCSYLKQNGHRQTQERFFIMDNALAQKAPFSAKELHEVLLGAYFTLSPATIYNTLELLCRAGLLMRSNCINSCRYYSGDAGTTWVECRHCGKLQRVKDRSLTDAISTIAVRGFTAGAFNVSITGVCSACARKLKAKNGI